MAGSSVFSEISSAKDEIRWINFEANASCTYTLSIEKQAWPVFTVAQCKIACAARSISALSKTIAGSFPPSSRNAGFNWLAARVATCRPVSTLPVKLMTSTRSMRLFPVDAVPGTTSTTAPNSTVSLSTWLTTSIKRGVISLGLMMTEQPAKSAGTASRKERIRG